MHDAFADAVRETFGLVFPPGREQALDEGVLRACSVLAQDDPVSLLRHLRQGDGATQVALADVLTVGETYFFRDPQHFALLRRLLERAEAPMRLWSAGCASGAEPYTMAILARDLHGKDASERVSIFGSDLSEQALTKARAGRFRPWALRGVDDDTKRRWFRTEGQELVVVDEVRELVRFGRLNLLEQEEPAWPGDVDVIFCRNVLVYFSADAIETAARGFQRALSDTGWLIAGPSDPLLSPHGLVVDASGGFIAYRRQLAESPPAVVVQPRQVAAPIPPVPAPKVTRDALPKRLPASVAPVPVAAPEPQPAPPTPDDDGLLAQVRALADAGDSLRALAALDDVIRERPLEGEAYLLRAVLAQALGRHTEVVRDAKRALLLDRSLVYAHIVAAPSAAALGDVSAAKRGLRNARASLLATPPDTPITATTASAEELLSACAQLERTLLGGGRA